MYLLHTDILSILCINVNINMHGENGQDAHY